MEPEDVEAAGGGDMLGDGAGGDGRFGAGIGPAMDLGVAIGEVESSGTIVVTGGDINEDVEVLFGGITLHIDDEEAVVDAVFAFVDHDPGL